MKTYSKTRLMVTTAMSAYVMPKLAKDKKLDVVPYFKGLTAKTYAKDIKGMVTKLCTDAAGMLAPPAGAAAGAGPAAPAAAGMGPDDVIHMLASHIIGGEAPSPEAMKTDEIPMGMEGEEQGEDDGNEALMSFLAECGLSPEMIEKAKGMLGGGDPTPKPGDEDNDDDKGDKETEDEEDMPVTQEAMDKAIKKATDSATARVKADMTATADAREFVRPWVGAVAMTFDSAEKVLKAACGTLKIEGVDKINDVSALRLLIQSKPQIGAKLAIDKQPVLAVDADEEKALFARYPGAKHIAVG